MEHLFLIKEPILIVLTAIFFLLSVGQTIHTLMQSTQKESRLFAALLLYEVLILIHLLLGCNTAASALQNNGEIFFRLKSITIALEPYLWINLFTALWGLMLTIKLKRPHMIFELIVIAACTPACIDLLDGFSWLLLSVDAGFFLTRITSTLIFDFRHQTNSISRLSLIETVNKLPEGFLCANKRGNVLIMNDTMRNCLVSLGFATDHIKAHSLWSELKTKEQAETNLVNGVSSEGIRLPISPFETRLFIQNDITLHRQNCECIIALDVTEEEQLNTNIEHTNRLLAAANKELEHSIHQLQIVAENEALLTMKARVHDIIGQRLSILHRYLEDENPDSDTLEEIIQLLNHVIDDLNHEENPEKQAELDSIIDAFHLIDVTIDISGALPENPELAGVYVRIIREAITNAVKHAQASVVSLVFGEQTDRHMLTISNNGLIPKHNIQEGTGFPSMRKAAQSVGGSFTVSSNAPFTIKVVVPSKGDIHD